MSSNPVATQPTEWCRVCTMPDALVEGVLPAVPRGVLCYLGPLTVGRASWLGQAGFEVELAELECGTDVKWPDAAAVAVAAREVDARTMALPDLRYALVILDGVLPLLPPSDGDRLLASVRRSTRPGGVVIASALTVEDPAYEALRPAAAARRSFRFDDGRWLRFYMRGELAMAFDGWMLLHAGDEAATDEDQRPRMMSVVVARRPTGGSLLA